MKKDGKINVIICGGEQEARERIRNQIQKLDPDAHIRELSEAEDVLRQKKMDMLFLDIQSGQMSGIEAAKKLRCAKVPIPIIFTAAEQDHVFDAFDVGAFQYLTQPVDGDTLAYVYRKAKQLILQEGCSDEKQLIISTKKMKYSLRPDQILYAENDRKKIVLHTAEENIVIYGTMKELKEKLGNIFYRCHRGYLVNMNHIRGYNGECIQVDNGDCIYLSREKYSNFVKTYTTFLEA